MPIDNRRSVRQWTPGAWERAYREKRRLRAAELFDEGVPNVLIADRLGVSDTAVDAWKARWEVGDAAGRALDRLRKRPELLIPFLHIPDLTGREQHPHQSSIGSNATVLHDEGHDPPTAVGGAAALALSPDDGGSLPAEPCRHVKASMADERHRATRRPRRPGVIGSLQTGERPGHAVNPHELMPSRLADL